MKKIFQSHNVATQTSFESIEGCRDGKWMRWTPISANQQASFVSFACLYGVISTVWPIEESVTPISSSAPELYFSHKDKVRSDQLQTSISKIPSRRERKHASH